MAVTFVPPMLCKLLPKPFDASGWVFEHKLDGIRIIATKQGQIVKLFTRNGKDRAKQFPEVVKVIQGLEAPSVILDGEITAQAKPGKAFQAIQPRVQQTNAAEIARLARSTPVVYWVFDVLYLNSKSLLKEPLSSRKQVLRKALGGSRGKVRYLTGVTSKGKALFAKAKRLGWEGIVGKTLKGRYLPGIRGHGWVKIKTHEEQELVIGGYTKGYGTAASSFGALLVGYYKSGKLKFAGEVGTGYTQAERRKLKITMDKHKMAKSPFAPAPKEKEVTWLYPVLVGQFKFAEWTNKNILRVPVYLGLRDDKPAKLVKQEK